MGLPRAAPLAPRPRRRAPRCSRARERYQQGAGTQFELVQAERDAFSAEVSRIESDADLSYARAGLRLDAGHTLDEESIR